MIMAVQPLDFLGAMRMPVIGVMMTSMIVVVTFVVVIIMIMAMVIMIMPVVMPVVMIVVVIRMIMIGLAFPDRGLARERSNRIAEAGHLFFDRLEIAAAIVAHRHRARRHRYGDVFDAGHTPDGRIDLCCAGGTIHAANPVPCLCCFAHDFDPCL
jgi:uncharacterized protein YacL